MKQPRRQHNEIHKLLFMTAKQAHLGVERWFKKENIGITPLQFGVLRSIPEKGSTLYELARSMNFKPPSLIPSIDTLEHRGYITKRSDPGDRRKIKLVLGAKGEKTVHRVLASRKMDALALAFKKMSASKRKQMLSLLDELRENMN